MVHRPLARDPYGGTGSLVTYATMLT
ncbi:unnamed protein product, partial [Rotaria sp. Silwood2]